MRVRLSLSLVLVLALGTSLVRGQGSNRTATASLANTTWQVYYRINSSDSWDDYGRLRFLPDGIVEEITPATGYKCRGGKWRLVGQRLHITERLPFVEAEGNCAPSLVKTVNALLRGREIIGTAELGMNLRGFQVRLVRLLTPENGSPVIVPRGRGQSQPPSVRRLGHGRYALDLTQPQQEAVNQFLQDHPNLRLATVDFLIQNGWDETLLRDNIERVMRSGEMQFPHTCWGDLNRDGFLDVAIVFVTNRAINNWNWREWWVVIFHGNAAESYSPMIVTKEQAGNLDGLLYNKRTNEVQMIAFEVATGSFRWNGSRYIVRHMSGD